MPFAMDEEEVETAGAGRAGDGYLEQLAPFPIHGAEPLGIAAPAQEEHVNAAAVVTPHRPGPRPTRRRQGGARQDEDGTRLIGRTSTSGMEVLMI